MLLYKGFLITDGDDNTFDILEANRELVDGGFTSTKECKTYIDNMVKNNDPITNG
jgi:hypothetical protein